MQRILVVEDDPQIAGLISKTLQEGGYEAFAAFDGKSAIALFDNLKPQMVITDQECHLWTGSIFAANCAPEIAVSPF